MVAIGLPIAMLIVGSLYQNDCPALPEIPALIAAIGGLMSFCNLINGVDRCLGCWLVGKSARHVLVVMSNVALNGIVMILFVLLCCRIYGSKVPEKIDHTAANYCNPVVYLFSYWLTNSVVIFLWLIFTVAAICLCCAVLRD